MGKYLKNHKVLIFSELENTYQSKKVVSIDDNVIEFDDGLLTFGDSKKYYNELTGEVTYIYNLDIPTKLESGNLKTLRRSVALKNLFTYDKEQSFDLIKFIPYCIAIIAIIF